LGFEKQLKIKMRQKPGKKEKGSRCGQCGFHSSAKGEKEVTLSGENHFTGWS